MQKTRTKQYVKTQAPNQNAKMQATKQIVKTQPPMQYVKTQALNKYAKKQEQSNMQKCNVKALCENRSIMRKCYQ